jgi:hypothetical protein
MKVLIRSKNFLMESVKSFQVYNCIVYKRIIWLIDPFSFFLLPYFSKNSSTVLIKSRKSRHPCLIPDFRGNAFVFPTCVMFSLSFFLMPHFLGGGNSKVKKLEILSFPEILLLDLCIKGSNNWLCIGGWSLLVIIETSSLFQNIK